MAATRSNNTYEEALAGLMRNIADMKLIQDANLPFIIDIETKIVEEYKRPAQQMQQGGMMPSPAANPAGMGALGLPGAMAGLLGAPGGGMGGPPPPMPPPPPGMAPPPSMLGLGGMVGGGPGPPMPQSAAEVGALV